MEPPFSMKGFLQQTVLAAISKALLDKVTFVDDIQFTAEVKVTIDNNDPINFMVLAESLKKSAQLHQLQFSSLFGPENHVGNFDSNQLGTHEIESSAIQNGRSSIATDQTDLDVGVWSMEKEGDHIEVNGTLKEGNHLKWYKKGNPKKPTKFADSLV